MSVNEALRIIRERWRIILICLVLGLLGAAGALAVIPRAYSADVTLYVSLQGRADSSDAAYQASQLAKDRVVSRVGVDESFYGLAFSADGSTLLCSGAGSEVVHAFGFADGYASGHREVKIAEPKERAIPAGLFDNASIGSDLLSDHLD